MSVDFLSDFAAVHPLYDETGPGAAQESEYQERMARIVAPGSSAQ
ncbi:hypothetical protein [Kitasatospora sp. KL5]